MIKSLYNKIPLIWRKLHKKIREKNVNFFLIPSLHSGSFKYI